MDSGVPNVNSGVEVGDGLTVGFATGVTVGAGVGATKFEQANRSESLYLRVGPSLIRFIPLVPDCAHVGPYGPKGKAALALELLISELDVLACAGVKLPWTSDPVSREKMMPLITVEVLSLINLPPPPSFNGFLLIYGNPEFAGHCIANVQMCWHH